MTSKTKDECPCGTHFPYTDCCGPLIRGTYPADTAEDLMRSRYTAYAKKEWYYLIQTTHPDEKTATIKNGFDEWRDNVEWQKLEILDSKMGGAQDTEGEVTFQATYLKSGVPQLHHERSKFTKENGKWYYRENQSNPRDMPLKTEHSKPFVRKESKVGRNAPCPCGSGKKFKKCCGK